MIRYQSMRKHYDAHISNKSENEECISFYWWQGTYLWEHFQHAYHDCSFNKVMKYKARITSLHRNRVLKALKTCALSNSICHKLISSYYKDYLSVICLLNNCKFSLVKNNLYFIVLSDKEITCFTLKHWSVVVPTPMKLQWTPGNKVLWCPKWLAQSYLWPAGLSDWVLNLIKKVTSASHASHMKIGWRGRRN